MPSSLRGIGAANTTEAAATRRSGEDDLTSDEVALWVTSLVFAFVVLSLCGWWLMTQPSVSNRAVFPTTAAELAALERNHKLEKHQDQQQHRRGTNEAQRSRFRWRHSFSRCQVESASNTSQAAAALADVDNPSVAPGSALDSIPAEAAAGAPAWAPAADPAYSSSMEPIDLDEPSFVANSGALNEVLPDHSDLPIKSPASGAADETQSTPAGRQNQYEPGVSMSQYQEQFGTGEGDAEGSMSDDLDVDALETLPDSPERIESERLSHANESMNESGELVLSLRDVHLLDGGPQGVWASVRNSPRGGAASNRDDAPRGAPDGEPWTNSESGEVNEVILLAKETVNEEQALEVETLTEDH